MPVPAPLYDAIESFCAEVIDRQLDFTAAAGAFLKRYPQLLPPPSAPPRLAGPAAERFCGDGSRWSSAGAAGISVTVGPDEPSGATRITNPVLGEELLQVVYRQQYQAHVRRTALRHRTEAAMARYRDLFLAGESVASIACRPDVNFSPYLIARLLLESVCEVPRGLVGAAVKDPASIPHERLRQELVLACQTDPHCSPVNDARRAAAGDAYEVLLEGALRARGIPYQTEGGLREAGFSKTPDVCLRVPIGVLPSLPPLSSSSPRVINWIDSKAMFGDPATHRANLEQLQGYVNRFGPGMVVYWKGYAETIASPVHTPPDILVAEGLPRVWVLPGDEGTLHVYQGPPEDAALVEAAAAAAVEKVGGGKSGGSGEAATVAAAQ